VVALRRPRGTPQSTPTRRLENAQVVQNAKRNTTGCQSGGCSQGHPPWWSSPDYLAACRRADEASGESDACVQTRLVGLAGEVRSRQRPSGRVAMRRRLARSGRRSPLTMSSKGRLANLQSAASSEVCRIVKPTWRKPDKREPSLGVRGEGHGSRQDLGIRKDAAVRNPPVYGTWNAGTVLRGNWRDPPR
jgi:hypothetical protein